MKNVNGLKESRLLLLRKTITLLVGRKETTCLRLLVASFTASLHYGVFYGLSSVFVMVTTQHVIREVGHPARVTVAINTCVNLSFITGNGCNIIIVVVFLVGYYIILTLGIMFW